MENPAEVQELRNKLRMMKFPSDDILNTVRRQQRAIHKQKEANETILIEIEQYEKQLKDYQALDEKHKSDPTLQRLLHDHKTYSNKLSTLRADVDAETQKLSKLEDQASKARSKAGGIFAAAAENEQLASKQLTMENRLQQVYNKYNTNLRILQSYRSEADQFRKDRIQIDFVRSQKKAIREKADSDLQKLISKSNDMYTERDALKMETVTLKNTEKDDISNFQSEMTRYNQTIEAHKINQNRPIDAQPSIVSTNSTMGSQADQEESPIDAQIKQYIQTINNVLKIGGADTLDQLAEKVDEIERENFTLYSFVVEHSARLAELQQQNQRYVAERDAYIHNAEVEEERQNGFVAEMSSEIKNLEDMIRVTEEQNNETKHEFEQVYATVESTFKELGCSWEGSPNEGEEISSKNVMFGLSQIEKVVSELADAICERAANLFNEQGKEINPDNKVANEFKSLDLISNTRSSIFKITGASTTTTMLENNRPMTIEELKKLVV